VAEGYSEDTWIKRVQLRQDLSLEPA